VPRGPAYQGVHENSHEEDHEYKAGATALVKCAVIVRILGLIAPPLLEGVDHLVLCTVVLKDAAHIGHEGHCC